MATSVTLETSTTLCLTGPVISSARRAAAELVGILEEFQGWDDPLSQDLFEWGVKVADSGEHCEESHIYPLAQDRIHDLLKKILVDPIYGRAVRSE